MALISSHKQARDLARLVSPLVRLSSGRRHLPHRRPLVTSDDTDIDDV
jgi:hypothetical protein